ncbi:MAG: nucleotidyltransferase substrate binding protein [Bacteroidetes bacterium]|nr:nucleotidyltransferase substrate binding protein [Bacteroidota bacterium]
MSQLDTAFLERSISTLKKAYSLLQTADQKEIDYEMYRSACVKEFEIILEQSGKLLRKCLKPYFHSDKAVDRLHFKDVFRHAVLRGIITPELAERFFEYRDNRNTTAHDYGVKFAEETLMLLPGFIEDAQLLVALIKRQSHDSES